MRDGRWPAGRRSRPMAGVSETGRDKTLESQVVVGLVDDPRCDASPSPRLFQVELTDPPPRPDDDVCPVDQLEARMLDIADRAVAAGRDDPRVLQSRNGLRSLVGLRVEGEGEVELSTSQAAHDGLDPLDLAQDHLDVRVRLTKRPARGRHQFGGGRSRHADADARPPAAVASSRRRRRSPRPPQGRGARDGRLPHRS